MSRANILITGALGYLGGNILAWWEEASLPSNRTAYALVRSDKQASAVGCLGFLPIRFDAFDPASVEMAVLENNISIVIWLIDALNSDAQPLVIDALAKVKEKIGGNVHFIHTSGAKIFSSHAGAPCTEPFSDTDPELYGVQKSQQARVSLLQRKATDTNNLVIEQAESRGVRSYIFVPCLVYGQDRGLGNPIQYKLSPSSRLLEHFARFVASAENEPCVLSSSTSYDHDEITQDRVWPVSHITDTASLYLKILRGVLKGDDIGHGKNGYYLASSGNAVWDDVYSAIAASLHRRGAVDTTEVSAANEEDLVRMGQALKSSKELVPLQLSGSCTLTAAHGKAIGWQPEFGPEHVLQAADAEVDTF